MVDGISKNKFVKQRRRSDGVEPNYHAGGGLLEVVLNGGEAVAIRP